MRVDSRTLILAWKHPMQPHSFHTVEPDFFFYLRKLLHMIFHKNLIVQAEDKLKLWTPVMYGDKNIFRRCDNPRKRSQGFDSRHSKQVPACDFSDFQVPCPKMKNVCWNNLKLLWRMEAAHGEPKTEYPDEFYVTENKKRLIDERIKLIASLPHSISFSFGNELKAEISNSSS